MFCSNFQVSKFRFVNTRREAHTISLPRSFSVVCRNKNKSIQKKKRKTAPEVQKFIKTIGKTEWEVEQWFDRVKPESEVGLSLHIGFNQKAFATLTIGMRQECLIVQRDWLEYGRSDFPKVVKDFLEKEGITFFAYDIKLFKKNLYYTLKEEVKLERMSLKGVKQATEEGKLEECKGKYRFKLETHLEEKLVTKNDVDESVSDYLRDIVEFCYYMTMEEELE